MKAKKIAAEQLSLISGFLYRRLHYEARKQGIRWTALMVLNDLALLGACRQKDLCEIEQISEPTMTVLIQQLQDKKWIRKKADNNDARVRLVEITSKGIRELQKAGGGLRQVMEEELKNLDDEELTNMVEGLNPLFNSISQSIVGARSDKAPK